ncbi:MAG: hypothetical protein JGK17_14305 [Microcoleus sp. PH2017_10_PVI_O_A]|uniref:hypothetical protein n=1 Tax=unclassified Microcoleus TaxID=2642155 RepID=UPI001D2D4BA1|nr:MULTISPECIES: hypothetical protein [unclassified Microcoleus]TAE82008.1 MAG: hypothetical protein EAZ83_13940 [Oscillatoriales cyanobacterium]MCC3406734.1 hypothetical protein [Microcoleus sp. PH2017_10_PVI_O_A]MCC3460730.1 hypothetical protein [Microcoleus sp. PH2017_11_PCY_U_A]MCC3479293.1 hypothetical protein [Microcoleus sp. PH2017_12_PCY_D_A]MCC3528232.1 hypothetical protein [Microcoleus sp. PH2017_21_RUC_O_A]
MKRKLNWPGYGSANTASRIAACKLSTNTASTCTAGVWGGGCWLYLGESDIWQKKPQMFAPKTANDAPAVLFYVDGVSVSRSKSDIIGAALKK